jgi:hypothetical protein
MVTQTILCQRHCIMPPGALAAQMEGHLLKLYAAPPHQAALCIFLHSQYIHCGRNLTLHHFQA